MNKQIINEKSWIKLTVKCNWSHFWRKILKYADKFIGADNVDWNLLLVLNIFKVESRIANQILIHTRNERTNGISNTRAKATIRTKDFCWTEMAYTTDSNRLYRKEFLYFFWMCFSSCFVPTNKCAKRFGVCVCVRVWRNDSHNFTDTQIQYTKSVIDQQQRFTARVVVLGWICVCYSLWLVGHIVTTNSCKWMGIFACRCRCRWTPPMNHHWNRDWGFVYETLFEHVLSLDVSVWWWVWVTGCWTRFIQFRCVNLVQNYSPIATYSTDWISFLFFIFDFDRNYGNWPRSTRICTFCHWVRCFWNFSSENLDKIIW